MGGGIGKIGDGGPKSQGGSSNGSGYTTDGYGMGAMGSRGGGGRGSPGNNSGYSNNYNSNGNSSGMFGNGMGGDGGGMRSREENMRGMMGESRGGGRDMMRSNSDLMGRGDMMRNEMMGNMQVWQYIKFSESITYIYNHISGHGSWNDEQWGKRHDAIPKRDNATRPAGYDAPGHH